MSFIWCMHILNTNEKERNQLAITIVWSSELLPWVPNILICNISQIKQLFCIILWWNRRMEYTLRFLWQAVLVLHGYFNFKWTLQSRIRVPMESLFYAVPHFGVAALLFPIWHFTQGHSWPPFDIKGSRKFYISPACCRHFTAEKA